MSESGFPESIQILKFASGERQIAASAPLENLKRIKGLVYPGEEERVNFVLTGRIGESGEKILRLDLNAKVAMTCQSCLELMPIIIDSQVDFSPVFTDEQVQNLAKHLEPVVVDEAAFISVLELVEDELLLSIPAAPTHEEACLPRVKDSSEQREKPEKANPFAVLATIKKDMTGEDDNGSSTK